MLNVGSGSTLVARQAQAQSELVIAAADGRISYAKPRARRWLRDFFHCKEPRSRLPRAVHDWLIGPRAGGAENPLRPMLATADEVRLLIRAVPLGVERSHCLVLERRPVAAAPAAAPQWGLTHRQAEVLKWLVCGKSNAEIAALIGRKPNTVAKHLHCVFDKLGVDNRCGAVALAWEARLPDVGVV